MERVVWSLVAVVAVCVTWASAGSVVWNRGKDGLVHVRVEDIPGVHNVTVTVQGDKGHQSKVFIPRVSVDKTWTAVIPDTEKNDVIYYVIEYQLKDYVHRVHGSHSFTTTEVGVPLGSERYLQRRATTVFYDDFSSGHIASSKWTHDQKATGLGCELYSPEAANSYIKNGVLYIRPTFTTDRFGQNIMSHGTIDPRQLWGDCHPNWGGNSCHTENRENRPIISATLRSKGHIKYGKVEVVAKMPKGDWLWPGIWMMPTEGHYGGWPKSGEIDILEAAGNLHLKHPNGESRGVDHFGSNVHYGNARDGHGHAHHGGEYIIPHGTLADNFHTYWLDWNENHIRTGIDGHTVLTLNTPSNGFWNEAHLQGNNIWASGGRNAPFDRPFYLILDVAVAGGWFWTGYHNEPYNQPFNPGDDDTKMCHDFWNARHLWQPTWHGEDVALKIRSVKMQQY